jgi:serine protease Do
MESALRGRYPPSFPAIECSPMRLFPCLLAFPLAGLALAGCTRDPRPIETAGFESAAVRRPATPTPTRLSTPAEPPDPAGLAPDEVTVVNVARQLAPSVVSVQQNGGVGSGVVIRGDGVILTNAHVVGTARRVSIGLADGRELEATVLGRDPSVDVAVVQVTGAELPAAPLADSDALLVGQTAIAIGNPLGLERTLTRGVVSAINRSPRGFGLDGLIQTDAAISPGNSGGPLLDSQGQVIGINTAVISAPGASGLGFAIPINLARDIAEQLLTTGEIRRAFLGIDYREIDEPLARQFRLPVREGVIVTIVGDNTPAARAGLRQGDIVTAIGGEPVTQGADLRRAIRARKPGDEVRLRVQRPDGEQEIVARLGEVTIR